MHSVQRNNAIMYSCAGLAAALLCCAPAAAELRLEGAFQQGGLVQGKVPAGSQVRINGQALRVSGEGYFLLGFGRDAPPQATLVVQLPDGEALTRPLEIGQRDYPVQRIDGLPPRMVVPDAADLPRIRAEQARIAQARRRDEPTPYFLTGFQWPVAGVVTGVYGSRRILNGEPRKPHYGIDIAAPEGTPVRAPAPGRVSLAEPDMYFSGGTLIIDHGHGLSSTLIHLSKLLVEENSIVEQGQTVAEVGATGRSTGAHLDWRINLLRARLDPELVAGPPPAAPAAAP